MIDAYEIAGPEEAQNILAMYSKHCETLPPEVNHVPNLLIALLTYAIEKGDIEIANSIVLTFQDSEQAAVIAQLELQQQNSTKKDAIRNFVDHWIFENMDINIWVQVMNVGLNAEEPLSYMESAMVAIGILLTKHNDMVVKGAPKSAQDEDSAAVTMAKRATENLQRMLEAGVVKKEVLVKTFLSRAFVDRGISEKEAGRNHFSLAQALRAISTDSLAKIHGFMKDNKRWQRFLAETGLSL